jgi:hypothetical protein
VRVWGEGDEFSARFEAEDGHAAVYDSALRSYAYARKVDATGALVSTGIAVGDETDADRALLADIPLHLRDTSQSAADERVRRMDEDEREFGTRVAQLVESESDIEFEGKSREESWRLRKEEAIERLSVADNDTKIVALADKLSNIRAIYRDYQVIGNRVWDLFCVKDAASHEWHFRGLARALKSLQGTFAYEEFVDTIDKVFRKG